MSLARLTVVLATTSLAMAAPAAARRADSQTTRKEFCNYVDNPLSYGKFGKRFFTTTLRTHWCWNYGKVTRLGRVRIFPHVSGAGSAVGFVYKGVVARDSGCFNLFGVPHDACFVERTVKWQACRVYCGATKYVHLKTFLFYNGTAREANGKQ